MRSLDIHPNIALAWTPPKWFYNDPIVFAENKEKIFARTWQWIGDQDLVKVPGQVSPTILLEGHLDEPIVLTRDTNDVVRALSNVCTHRGNLVCEGAGNERFLRCRYHGRRFGLDGKFQFMPEFEGVEGFPCEKDDLPEIPFAKWGPFLFASINPAFSFESVMQPVFDRVGWLPIHQFAFDSAGARDYLVRGHWALYVDNYLEGFHIPFIHADLASVLDYGQYRVEKFDHLNLQVGVANDGEMAFDLPKSSPDFGQRIGAYYFWVFPNLMLNFYPWGLSVNVVRPLAPDLTKVSFFPYVWDASKRAHGAGAALDRVEREDEVVVELTQRGIKSRLYDRGRYSVAREDGTHHFHRIIQRYLEMEN